MMRSRYLILLDSFSSRLFDFNFEEYFIVARLYDRDLGSVSLSHSFEYSEFRRIARVSRPRPRRTPAR